jgi:hypothetical protein
MLHRSHFIISIGGLTISITSVAIIRMATEDGPCPSVLCAKIQASVKIFATRSYEWILGTRQGGIVLYRYKKLNRFIAKMLFFCIIP